MASTTYLQQAYLAYFGRPADVSGLSFYADKTEAAVVAAFSASTESQAFFGSLNTLAQINTIYQNLFNRAAEPAGLTYWAGEINAGRLSLAQASMGILAGAQNADKLAVTNKLAAAAAFTAALDTSDEMIGYQGTSVITSARAYLASVNDTAASLTAATATAALNASVATVVAAGVTGASSSAGSTFTLTTNIDNFAGSSGNDSVQGTEANLGALDTISGGSAGTDTLSLALTSATNTLTSSQITGFETLLIAQTTNANTGTGVVIGATGISTITNNGSTQTLIATGFDTVGTVNLNSAGANNTTISYTEAAVAGTADNVRLNVTAQTGGTVNINTATANTVGVETITLTTVGATANSFTLETNDTAGLTSLILGGTAAATIALGTNLGATATTINGSTSTGALTISGFGAAAHTVTGGTGADRFQMGSTLGATDLINGGSGTDTLSANGATLAAFATASRISSIETLEMADDVGATATTVAITSANHGTINNIRISDQVAVAGTAAVTFSGITAATTGSNNFRFDGDLGATGGLFTFGITDATVGGTANAATLDMRGAATTATSAIALAGVETITIDTTNATGAQLFTLTATALTTLTVTGGNALDIDSVALGTVVGSVNASAMTAGLNIALNTSSVSSASVTTGSGADLIVGSQLGDVISSGSGNDDITGGLGADTINVGSGTDKINFAAVNAVTLEGVLASGADLTLADKITGMGNGDTIDLDTMNNIAVANGAIGVGTTFATANANEVVIVSGSFNATTNIFTSGAASTTNNDYLLQFNAGTSTTTVNSILMIDIVGTVTAISATEIITLSVA